MIPQHILAAILGQEEKPKSALPQSLGSGLMSTGLSMLANSSNPGSTFASNLGRGALEEGLPAFERSQRSAQEKVAIDEITKNMPPEMAAVMRLDPYMGLQAYMGSMQAPEVDRTVQRQADGTLAVIENGQLANVIGPETDTSAEDEETTFRRTDSLSDDYYRETVVHKDTAQAVGAALSASDTPSGDQSRIIAINKILQPGSSVLEGEFNRAAAAGDISDRAQWYLNQLVNGRLPSRIRDDLDTEIRSQVQGAMAQFEPSRERFRFRSQAAGVDPDQVTQDWYAPIRTMLENAPPPGGPPGDSDDDLTREYGVSPVRGRR